MNDVITGQAYSIRNGVLRIKNKGGNNFPQRLISQVGKGLNSFGFSGLGVFHPDCGSIRNISSAFQNNKSLYRVRLFFSELVKC